MQQDNATPGEAPAWVGLFLMIARPVIPITVLVISAPAEQALADLVGWTPRLAWGMAVILATYGAVAAVVATYVPTTSRFFKAALYGACGAVALAMAAQVTGHLITTGHLLVTPVPVWLVVAVSMAPGLVLAHVMHLSWVKVPVRPWRDTTAPVGPEDGDRAPEAAEDENGPQTAAEDSEDGQDDGQDGPPDFVPEEWTTVKEAAIQTGRTESTVRGWIHERSVTFVKDGRRTLVKRSTLPAAIPTITQEVLSA